jgi:dienelactone hydrolase
VSQGYTAVQTACYNHSKWSRMEHTHVVVDTTRLSTLGFPFGGRINRTYLQQARHDATVALPSH